MPWHDPRVVTLTITTSRGRARRTWTLGVGALLGPSGRTL